MDLLNQKLDSEEEDEDYIPEEDKHPHKWKESSENEGVNILKDIKSRKQDEEVDAIWEEMMNGKT